jgi:hypothetical protein
VRGPEPEDSLAATLRASGEHWSPLLRLTPRRVALHQRRLGAPSDPVEIDLAAYRRAEPDPLMPLEAEWLAHLDAGHHDMLAALAAYVAPGVEADSVRPVELTCRGLRLRCGDRDVQVAFERPVRCGCDLAEAFADILERCAPDGPRLDCAD